MINIAYRFNIAVHMFGKSARACIARHVALAAQNVYKPLSPLRVYYHTSGEVRVVNDGGDALASVENSCAYGKWQVASRDYVLFLVRWQRAKLLNVMLLKEAFGVLHQVINVQPWVEVGHA